MERKKNKTKYLVVSLLVSDGNVDFSSFVAGFVGLTTVLDEIVVSHKKGTGAQIEGNGVAPNDVPDFPKHFFRNCGTVMVFIANV